MQSRKEMVIYIEVNWMSVQCTAIPHACHIIVHICSREVRKEGRGRSERKEGERMEGERMERERKKGERKEEERKEGERKEGERKEGERKKGERKEGERKEGKSLEVSRCTSPSREVEVNRHCLITAGVFSMTPPNSLVELPLPVVKGAHTPGLEPA